jgi:pSer/pThr/pTyr-binding forkhead associated (FHA) protein
MICAYCKSDIESDSFYCDQCSKEVFVCQVCGKPGKGKNCVDDGGALLSQKQKAAGGPQSSTSPAASKSLFGQPATPPSNVPVFGQPAATPPNLPVFGQQTNTPPNIPAFSQPSPLPGNSMFGQAGGPPIPSQSLPSQKPHAAISSSIPALKLTNSHLKIDIDLKDGAIIGRSSGDYVALFSGFSQISGKHLQFIYDKNNGWCIKDLGSTNGVFMSTQPNWAQVPRLSPNTPVAIKDNTYLLIANIEFQIKSVLPQFPTTGTSRV